MTLASLTLLSLVVWRVVGLPAAPVPPSTAPAASPAPPSNCEYWCRTPEDTFYCCHDDQLSDPTEHPGYCPATRSTCPTIDKKLPETLPRRDYNGITFPDLPRFCATDGSCEHYEKCCFDRCFRKHVCKFAFSEDTKLKYSDKAELQADVVQHTIA
ncbi:uncharacterized protein [Cherax quadricarinatus]|uniref:uncharacterized protein isoform X2 n=1 Tax=Cherax quadricarinatus TaxID=27406 RepID=UPI00387EA97D